MKNLILMTMLLLLLYGCGNEAGIPVQPMDSRESIGLISIPDTDDEVTIECVMQIGENFFNRYNSRSDGEWSILPFKDEQGVVKTYVLNYGTNNGYLVVSANKKVYPIIVSSEEGSLDVSCLTSSPMGDWIVHMASLPVSDDIPDSVAIKIAAAWDNLTRRIAPYQISSRSTGDPTIDNTISQAIAIWNSQGYTVTSVANANASAYPSKIATVITNIQNSAGLTEPNRAQTSFVLTSTTTNSNRVGPFIKTKWTMNDPYNAAVKVYRSDVPQVALDVAQIMYYHNKPTSLNLSKLPLSLETATASDPLPQFLAKVTEKCGLGPLSTSSVGTVRNIKYGFDAYGYSYEEADYNISKVINSLNNYGPLIFGYHINKTGDSKNFDWICDGYNSFSTSTRYKIMSYTGDLSDISPVAAFATVVSDNVTATSPMALHFVWGYNNALDSWYYDNDWRFEFSPSTVLNIAGKDVKTILNIR